MVDLRKDVYEALDAVLAGRAFFLAPPADAVEPCLSFMELDNADAVFADDTAALSEIVYAVEIWAAAARDVPPLARAVDAAMKALGFDRVHASDLPPDEFHLVHKNMQYAITV